MINKKAVLVKNIIGFVIGGASVILLIVLAVLLLSPSFNKAEKTAESYFESLEKEIAKADEGNIGEFEMWGNSAEDTFFYLIYFGDAIAYDSGEGLFYRTSDSSGDNALCICYSEKSKGNTCYDCLELEHSANLENNIFDSFREGERWDIPEKYSVKISLREEKYILKV